MSKTVVRKIELFAMHAHPGDDIDYEEIFVRLHDVPRAQRVVRVRGIVVGFPIVEPLKEGWFIQITEGDPADSTLIYDQSTGGTREASLGEAEIISQATHMVVTPSARRAAVEYVRRGIKAPFIAQAIEGIVKRNSPEYGNFNLELVAVTAPSFIEAIDDFKRIRVAGVRMVKPNATWTDHHTHLSKVMESSNGGSVEMDVSAQRNGSLSKDDGIVDIIKEVAEEEYPYLGDAKITGTRRGEDSETTLRAKKHIEHTKANIVANESGHVRKNSILRALRSFISLWL
ncbi:hypothetical protein [Pararhizobium mangrovi]|uniref:Uncharacterized protein n=1 Tax=Pararhizobium mangrovi TaxID=2590452 RepID=A0A506TWZ9_9HYPH|nr:hypothetical protein [Pararhizobium mangrovi]TPW26040.1 hypothetical protein FJU11_16635 [Pararhizobium mangrovi]